MTDQQPTNEQVIERETLYTDDSPTVRSDYTLLEIVQALAANVEQLAAAASVVLDGAQIETY